MSAAEATEQAEAPARLLTIEAKPMPGFGGGFRSEWVSGEAEGVTVTLDSGAGLGNPYLTLHVEVEGVGDRWEVIDVRPLLQAWAREVETEIRAEASE